MNKAYIVLGNRFGESAIMARYGFTTVPTMEEADFVVFTGGEDINPRLYGEVAHSSVYYNNQRDAAEIKGYEQARELGLPMFGICRGAQLLNVLVGGSLYQDVNKHGSYHNIITDTGEVFETTSVHHQMMRPREGAIIKAWADCQATRRIRMDEGYAADDGEGIDPEIVIYPDHRMLLVQGHPEFSTNVPELETFRQYVFKLLKSL